MGSVKCCNLTKDLRSCTRTLCHLSFCPLCKLHVFPRKGAYTCGKVFIATHLQAVQISAEAPWGSEPSYPSWDCRRAGSSNGLIRCRTTWWSPVSSPSSSGLGSLREVGSVAGRLLAGGTGTGAASWTECLLLWASQPFSGHCSCCGLARSAVWTWGCFPLAAPSFCSPGTTRQTLSVVQTPPLSPPTSLQCTTPTPDPHPALVYASYLSSICPSCCSWSFRVAFFPLFLPSSCFVYLGQVSDCLKSFLFRKLVMAIALNHIKENKTEGIPNLTIPSFPAWTFAT